MKTRVDIIKVNDIELGQRYREDYGDIDDLVADIKEKGLIQPLAVIESTEEGGSYRLLAGGRRFTAAKQAGIENVPANIYPNTLSELQTRGIELAENLCRKDLEWKEQIKLQQEIHRLYQNIHGTKTSTSKVTPGEGWGERDTAGLVNKSQGSVHQDLQLANALESAPELFSDCKNKHDAAKVLRSVRENQLKEELTRRVETQAPSSSSSLTELANSFIVGDFFEKVKSVPDGAINFVEFDPPYSIDLHKTKRQNEGPQSETLSQYNEISRDKYLNWMRSALEECYRVMAEHSWLVLWFAPEPWFESMYNLLNQTGFHVHRMVGIWAKGSTGQNQHPDVNLTNSYEMFFYARKGSPAMAKRGRSNLFNFAPVPNQKKRHPTERPIDLMMEILSTFVDSGSRVMVPCLGSGVTILAAHQLGMSAFGYELSEGCKGDFLLALEE